MFISQDPTSPNLISTDLTSSELVGYEPTQFAVAATNQNGLIALSTCLRHVTTVVTVGLYIGCATYCVLIGRSRGGLRRFTVIQFG